MNPHVFSRFVTTYTCDGKATQHTTYIEPLSHGLRHPNALCNRGTDLMDRTYLLPAHKADHATASKLGNVRCQNRTCQAMYFDLGATTLQPTPDEAGQGWFFNAYKRQGITFDRFLLWEAVARAPAEVFQNVPKADMHKYQYFNIPVTPDSADMSNPVNILKVRWPALPWGDGAQCTCSSYSIAYLLVNAALWPLLGPVSTLHGPRTAGPGPCCSGAASAHCGCTVALCGKSARKGPRGPGRGTFPRTALV
jgi:hypothetical protein